MGYTYNFDDKTATIACDGRILGHIWTGDQWGWPCPVMETVPVVTPERVDSKLCKIEWALEMSRDGSEILCPDHAGIQ